MYVSCAPAGHWGLAGTGVWNRAGSSCSPSPCDEIVRREVQGAGDAAAAVGRCGECREQFEEVPRNDSTFRAEVGAIESHIVPGGSSRATCQHALRSN